MNTEPPTGDDLTRMLVSMKTNVLERAADVPRRRRGHRFGIAFGLVALLGVGTAGGGVAFGLIPSPFEGIAQSEPTVVESTEPAPTPSATAAPAPSAPPAAEPDYSPPLSALPMDCTTLASESSLTSLLRAPEMFVPSPLLSTVEKAGSMEAGVLSCSWNSDGDAASADLAVAVSPDTATGGERIAEQRTAGASDQGVGDASTVQCVAEQMSCRGNVVVGDYWIEYSYRESPTLNADIVALLTEQIGRMAEVARAQEPQAAWEMPEAGAKWVATGDCSTLLTTAPMSTLVESPAMADVGIDSVYEAGPGGTSVNLGSAYHCAWSTPETDAVPYERIDVGVDPGGRWAYDARSVGFAGTDTYSVRTEEPIDVVGAQDATLRCEQIEMEACGIDVLVDDSWLQIAFSSGFTRDEAPLLVAVAESLIAARG